MKQEKTKHTASQAILAQLTSSTKELARILRDKEAAVRKPRAKKADRSENK